MKPGDPVTTCPCGSDIADVDASGGLCLGCGKWHGAPGGEA